MTTTTRLSISTASNTPCRAYIALGSNLRKPLLQLQRALSKLRQHPQIQLRQISSWYWSDAIGPGRQQDYLNGVIALDTTLQPQALLRALQTIEKRHGRAHRTMRWSARPLDLDILLYSERQLRDKNLQIPHPRLHERLFVLQGLVELRADLRISIDTSAQMALARLNGIRAGRQKSTRNQLQITRRQRPKRLRHCRRMPL